MTISKENIMATNHEHVAQSENTVSKLYQDEQQAKQYIENRFSYSWQRLLHESQFKCVDTILQKYAPMKVLEIAPGPARIAADLNHIRNGYMVEYSSEMIDVAKQRLQESKKKDQWVILHGNAFNLSEIKDLPDEVDFIYTFRFIRHFKTDDRIRLYNEIWAKLAKKGLVMFDVVNRQVREKLDLNADPPPKNALSVYDISYTENEFQNEMKSNGFKVLSMNPVLKLFPIQYWISLKLFDIIPRLHEKMIHGLECVPYYKKPLEWIVLCQKQE